MSASGAAVEALWAGRAFVDLSSWRKVVVTGGEAAAWLNDLLSADLAGLRAGSARRSLLLSPTGRIRADVTVALLDTGILLLQDPIQPRAIDALLAPYVLSSDVALKDRTSALALFALPGPLVEPPPDAIGRDVEVVAPSCLGPGIDLVVPSAAGSAMRERLRAGGLVTANGEDVEAWRIERGAARFGVDLVEDSLPHEASLDHAIGYAKGCFLGQEAVARVRNLGHPTHLVLAARSEDQLRVGQRVVADEDCAGAEAGVVTSAARSGGGTAAIVRVRWVARDRVLRTEDGTAIRIRGPASGEG